MFFYCGLKVWNKKCVVSFESQALADEIWSSNDNINIVEERENEEKSCGKRNAQFSFMKSSLLNNINTTYTATTINIKSVYLSKSLLLNLITYNLYGYSHQIFIVLLCNFDRTAH